jgi:CelD/BcsL family acetyltransferase involved in cellulose biosynthesis
MRIFGSPFPGWTTDYLGPVLQQGVDMETLLTAIVSAFKRDHIYHAELCHNAPAWASASHAQFENNSRVTFVATIIADPEEMLSGFSKTVRKTIKQSLRPEIQIVSSKDPSFIDVYYDQLREVFEKSGIEPTYSKDRVRALWTHLMPTGRMLNTMVLMDNQCIATRIDFFGDDSMHSFGSASYRDYLKYHPNEIARYHAMCEAAKRGLKHFDMSGGGEYKIKFNAERVEARVLIMSSPPFMVARQMMKAWHHCRNRMRYLLSKSK